MTSRLGRLTFLDLGPADVVTLLALLLALASLAAADLHRLSLAIAFMNLSMLADMLDGPLARRTRGPTAFGGQLDSLVDVFIYLAAPMTILARMGLDDPWSAACLIVYVACGLLRLANFNVIGTVDVAGRPHHLGLPVIWSHLLVVTAFATSHVLGAAIEPWLCVALLVMSLLMVSTVRFPKPTRYGLQAAVILISAATFFWLDSQGMWIP